MAQQHTISSLARTLRSLESSLPDIESEALGQEEISEIIQAKYFKPQQDEQIAEWFTKFLTVRGSLWEIIDEVHSQVTVGLKNIQSYEEYQFFVIGYVAACHVVRLDRFLLEQFATHTFIQRKLNEGIPEKKVPRKQYTHIFESFIAIENAQRMLAVMNHASKERNKLKVLANDPDVGYFINNFYKYRSVLYDSKQNYLERGVHFVKHAFKRRGASIKQHSQFKVLEASGRVFSELVNKKGKLVTPKIREQVRALLQPGDVMVTRHKYALTNLFLPGFWPHAAFYVGSCEEREANGITVESHIHTKWCDDKCTFEALKDGVLFRPLEETLAVDAFVILRPTISQTGINQAIERIVIHEGKKYNFDFDFFRADRLVCTELMYRAFDGIEHMNIELKERAGRPTLSAEDLCDIALDTNMFEPVAIYGVKDFDRLVLEKAEVKQLLTESFRN